MAVIYKKIIAIKTFSINGTGWTIPPMPSLGASYGQTYELESAVADKLITDGYVIDYATALSNPKCPPILRTKAIRIG
ncbi:hypothetical protein [Bacillus cereus group sp. TH152-1LC]|uniref:hypothetical protein n=1 Tax=Bacillus cereus group sp. TH152-1LC TaxID=3018060 RepID=UPI0022E1DFA1|nr:hypothetical protein [Bacillus cereus group sp. TH152-1LC]MDA1678656.1 hypothetical protein [Bacillus cereus group sp. TH152-1LC]